MTIHWLDYAIIILYFFVVVYIGYWAMKKVTNFDDYAVAGRGLPMSIFFAAIAATLCGGGATIGRVSFMHTTGIVVFAGLIGVVINQIFSGLYIAGRVHNIKNVYSVGDLFGLYYGRAGRLVSSIVCFFFCLGLYGVQILAMGAILQTAVGIDLIPAALISSVITLAYTWSGGMLAVTMTDAVQYVIIIIGVSLCGYLAIDHLGGFDAMMATLNAMPRYESNLKLFSGWGPIQFAGLFLSFLFGEFCAPYFIQRYASTKSAKDSKAGVLIFSVHWIFFLATTAGIGLASMALQPDVKPDLAFTNLIRDVLPIGVTGLVLAALLAAVMSSGAAFINTACVVYTRDIYNKFINPQATQDQMLRQSRMSTLLVGGVSIGVAILFQDVFGLMIYIFKLWPSAIIPPLLAGLLWGKVSPYAGAPAVVIGVVSCFLWSDKVLGEPFGIPANLIGPQLPDAVRRTSDDEAPRPLHGHLRPRSPVSPQGDYHAGIHEISDLCVFHPEHRLRRMGAHRHRPVDCGNEQEKLTGTVGRGCVPPAGGTSSP